ncbi:MAG: hypothetical protein ABSC48_17620 [Terracidiphilus sp.]|jgi:HPt (histidine-containing phosphotransfer) domain-containing protein
MTDFAKVYGGYSNDELARLAADISSLTEDAKTALANESKRRGLTPSELAVLAREQSEYTASVNKQWQELRREDVRKLGRRFAIRLALSIAGALLAIGLAYLAANHQTRYTEPASTTQH